MLEVWLDIVLCCCCDHILSLTARRYKFPPGWAGTNAVKIALIFHLCPSQIEAFHSSKEKILKVTIYCAEAQKLHFC